MMGQLFLSEYKMSLPNSHRPLRAAAISMAVIFLYFAITVNYSLYKHSEAITAQRHVSIVTTNVIHRVKDNKDFKDWKTEDLEIGFKGIVQALDSDVFMDLKYTEETIGTDFSGSKYSAKRTLTLDYVPRYGSVDNYLCDVYAEHNKIFNSATSCVEVGDKLLLVTMIDEA